MTQQFKLFFDECCSKRLAHRIVEIYSECYPDIVTKHLTDYFTPGTDDGDWLPMLEREKDWIVLTADRGKDPKKQKLPLICERVGITHISMTPGLVNSGYKAQKQALLCVWPQIINLGLLPKPTKVSLGFRMVDKGLSKVPYLYVQQTPLAIWCSEKGIQFSN